MPVTELVEWFPHTMIMNNVTEHVQVSFEDGLPCDSFTLIGQ